MIVVTSNYLKTKELSMVRKYARFVLDRMVRRGVQNKSRITVKILGEQEIHSGARS